MIHHSSTLAAPLSPQVEASSGATRAASRAPGGLGRGLAGILGEVRPPLTTNRRRGLQQLLGRGLEASLPRVRQFVTDTALSVIADGFGAEAVVIARRDGIGLPAVVSSRIPPSWEEAPGLTFELFGQLWRLLDEAAGEDEACAAGATAARRVVGRVVEIGGRQVWLGLQGTAEGYLVAAVARDDPYIDAENETLGRLVRSLAVAVGADGPTLAPGALVAFDVGPLGREPVRPGGSPPVGDEDRYQAEVCLDLGGARRRANGLGVTPELAVARAAASSCGVACEVRFAGRARLDGATVTLVLVDDGAASPLLGLSVSDGDDDAGAVEAVVSAVSVIGPPGARH